MRWRLTIVCVSVVALFGASPSARGQQNPYRLIEPNQTKACLGCHTDFAQKLKKLFVHTAVKSGDCSGCHDPHVSSHPRLLSGGPKEICAGCHDRVIPAKAKSVHKVVADGECQKCHDPHASDSAALLVKKGDALCFDCHEEIVERASLRSPPSGAKAMASLSAKNILRSIESSRRTPPVASTARSEPNPMSLGNGNAF